MPALKDDRESLLENGQKSPLKIPPNPLKMLFSFFFNVLFREKLNTRKQNFALYLPPCRLRILRETFSRVPLKIIIKIPR